MRGSLLCLKRALILWLEVLSRTSLSCYLSRPECPFLPERVLLDYWYSLAVYYSCEFPFFTFPKLPGFFHFPRHTIQITILFQLTCSYSSVPIRLLRLVDCRKRKLYPCTGRRISRIPSHPF